MPDGIWFPPLDRGAIVVSIVVPHNHLQDIHAVNIEDLCAPHQDGCDLVLLSVPAGDGMAVEYAARRMLRVQ